MLGLGFDVDPGSSEWVSAYRPGVLGVACWPFSEHPEGGSKPETRTLTIHDPDQLFVEWELQCNDDDDGTALDIRLVPSPGAPGPESIMPGEARPLINGLREDDDVVTPGYPEEVHTTVVVIREGRRIATVGFSFEQGRWIQAGGHVCGSMSVVG